MKLTRVYSFLQWMAPSETFINLHIVVLRSVVVDTLIFRNLNAPVDGAIFRGLYDLGGDLVFRMRL